MVAAGAHRDMPEGATALEIPSESERPSFVNRPCYDCLPAATAVFLPREMLAERPANAQVYLNVAPNPEAEYQARRYAHAYITPADSPCRAEPGPFLRLVFRTLALDLPHTFEILPPEYGHGADATVRFRTPENREAAMGRQPFVLDGATVTLLREGETPDVRRVTFDYIVHAVLRDYPAEQLSWKMIEDNCNQFGYVREIAPVRFTSPDLATVRVVLQLEDPREIARELRIGYGDRSTSIVPVEIVSVWHRSHSYDANGQYVRLFEVSAVAP